MRVRWMSSDRSSRYCCRQMQSFELKMKGCGGYIEVYSSVMDIFCKFEVEKIFFHYIRIVNLHLQILQLEHF
jgi:hypothetical protein